MHRHEAASKVKHSGIHHVLVAIVGGKLTAGCGRIVLGKNRAGRHWKFERDP